MIDPLDIITAVIASSHSPRLVIASSHSERGNLWIATVATAPSR